MEIAVARVLMKVKMIESLEIYEIKSVSSGNDRDSC